MDGFPLLEIGVVWTRRGGDQRSLDSVRGREWRGGEGFVPCVWVLKESNGRKEEKGEKGVYGEREDTRGYGNCEPNIVLK